jgi:hypothetical protein
MDAVGRPQVTLWTQLAALCLTPIAVVIGAQWGLEEVAIGFVLSQLVAVEIPMLIIVLSELRVSPATLAARLLGVAGATLLMVTACLLCRTALSELQIGMAGRAAVTIAVGAPVYATALWLLAPDVARRAASLFHGAVSKAIDTRRRRAVPT